jgi:O-antigen/teichoic acid export membrane protein
MDESSGHLEPTEELSLEVIKKRTVRGVATLTGRTFILQAISLVATFVLTIFLNPSEYGLFFLVSAIINFFAYFSDVGLAAALIQKKDKLTNEDLKTTFVVQQTLVITVLILIFVLTPLLSNWYKMNDQAIFLLWSLAFSLLLSSLKTIPSVLLERKLDFGKLVIPQIVETLLFNIVAVYFAWRGFGISSFAIAVLVRGISGLLVMYLLSPWKPGFAFSKASLKSLFHFGLPYQLNTFLAVFKDDGMTAILGVILGPSGVGLLGWAQKWAAAPLRFFMDQVIKVTFPAYARLQDNKVELSKAVSKSILFITLVVFPSLVTLMITAPVLVEIVPRYKKWEPALLALSLICINSAWAAVTTPLTNLLSAIGKINITFKLMIMWTGLTWAFLPALSLKYGINGAALGYALVGLSSIIAIITASRYVDLDFLTVIFKPFFAALIMGVVMFFLRGILPVSWLGFGGLVIVGAAVYIGVIILIFGPSIIGDSKAILLSVKSRK